MRLKWVLIGVWLAAVAAGAAWAGADYVLPDATEERVDRIRNGMTDAEVEAILGPHTAPHFVFARGRLDPNTPSYYAHQWERPSAVVRVYFNGSSAWTGVSQVERLPPISWLGSVRAAERGMWVVVGGMALLSLFGLVVDSREPAPV